MTDSAKARRLGPAVAWALLLELAALAVCLAVSRSPLFITRQTDADALLAVSLAEDLSRHAYAWTGFELPRVTSLFPDLALQIAASAVTPSRGWALFVYGAVQFQALVLACALVVRRLTGAAFLRAAAVTLAVVSLPVLADLLGPGGTGFAAAYLVSCFHAGPYVLGLAGALVAANLAERWRWSEAGLLFALAFAEVLSDRLTIANFILPAMIAAAGASWLERRRLSRPALNLAGLLGAAAVLALALDRRLNRQPDQKIDRMQFASRFVRFAHDTLVFAAQHPLQTALGVALPVAVLLAWPLLRRGQGGRQAVFLWIVAVMALLGTAALAGLFAYEDIQSDRYFAPALLWPLAFAAAALCRARIARLAVYAAGGAGLVALLAGFARPGAATPGSVAWTSPLAQCLVQQRGPLGLKAGIADYWIARPAMLASDWRLQVVQSNPLGQPFVWGNDAFWYVKAFDAPQGRPAYNFIVIDRLDPAAVRARYGEPARTFECPAGAGTVWIYADAAKLTGAFLAPIIPPPGPYGDGCTDAVFGENRMLAACRTDAGAWRYTSLDRYGRRHPPFVNRNGRLAQAR